MTEPLLASVRVLDLGGAESDTVGRLYADLGADVLKIEPPGGRSDRQALPTVAAASIPFRLNNANKRCAVLDPADPDGRRTLLDLASTADIVIDSGRPGGTVEFGTSCAALAQQFSHLVVLSVTDFGTDGPYACWQATDPVLYALSTALSRTGPTAGAPVLPPAGLASGTAAAQAAWAALTAYYRRLRTGTGEYIDFSRFEAVLQSLDPPFGSEGQAAVGVKKTTEIWRGRPRNQNIYPIFACKDGHVRICLLSPRQWRGMRAWLGEPERFADPKFDTIAARYAASGELNALIGDFVAAQTMDALVTEGQARGVPIAAVLTPTETLASEHFGAVGALTTAEFAPGAGVVTPVGPFVVDGHHRGLRRLAPDSGADEPAWATTRSTASSPDTAAPQRPFDGMRILDLGVIVAGGELGRLFADLGAEVIKIESAAYPDGLRQAPPGQVMSRSWALTHRNEESLGIDLRTPAGAGLFSRLVTGADAVFANFKPGTLASLGFSYDRLRELNPRIVLAESSAFGATGPWSGRMGYGPLVRATTGVTSLWASADGGFYDATTIFPDHVSARLTAIAALAALIRRDRSGEPAHVHVSQAEAAISQLATRYVAESARAAGLPVADDTAAHRVYPCAGDDEWCVISLRSEADHAALESITGGDTAEWTRARDKTTVARTLQDAGIAAAPMNRAVDVPDDPQVRYRKLYSDMVHPLFDAPMLTETGPAPYTSIPPARLRPAPMPGEQTRRICRQILDISAEETDRLIAEGTLFAYRERP
ncbi:acyl-CoA transferase [Mycolicibacterium novocastrense]|uniref:CaiB/BaiF CoA-transferase family protein n=1 Tax=Mycolicibacterium novocastrense TaxID=59813 RepID=UPI0007462ED6|nr:CoA transferase [Mycolicibacterium novocastrense]KUH75057.1 acyl-CoA transferase [Mycolicibacterium novocastrense]KUH77128.1 acyl-CoA transferase [Mycolicibacterium novocastrense]KUH77439.1 acyl-CoA transferase [Mycolicibacterium novocastrense]